MSYLKNQIQHKNKHIGKWKPFSVKGLNSPLFCIASSRKLQNITSHAIRVTSPFALSIQTTANWGPAQRNGFHYRILVFYDESDSGNHDISYFNNYSDIMISEALNITFLILIFGSLRSIDSIFDVSFHLFPLLYESAIILGHPVYIDYIITRV